MPEIQIAPFSSLLKETSKNPKCFIFLQLHLFTVGKISDRRCQGEDRILQCELDGGAATSNIEKNRYNLLDLAFSQSWRDVNVSAYRRFY